MEELDELLEEAKAIIGDTGASTPKVLKDMLDIPYNRAVKIISQLVEVGFLSELTDFDGSTVRKIVN
ncbi:MAG: DNA translocase FtsK [Weeksellaceae bacterium]